MGERKAYKYLWVGWTGRNPEWVSEFKGAKSGMGMTGNNSV